LDILIYSALLIAISVAISTVLNVMIMRAAAEIATKEISKMEKRVIKLLKKII